MRTTTGYQRYEILHRASRLMRERVDELGRLISQEEGKTLAEGRCEAQRADRDDGALGRRGQAAHRRGAAARRRRRAGPASWALRSRVPCGVVVAITPFNFPLNLVCHKVGPALAAGNAVIVKPASDTPLSALRLVEILLEAGLPPRHRLPDRLGRRTGAARSRAIRAFARSASPAAATSANRSARSPA